MIVDFDDFHERNHRLDLLHRLKGINPAFKVTLFAVPAFCSPNFVDGLPDWMEVAVHGWSHGGESCDDSYEAANWSARRMCEVMASVPLRFVGGFKAPGWQISDGCYDALLSAGWWVADHPENDHRRPVALNAHVLGEGDHWHGHIQNVCGNGIEERWSELVARVAAADTFEFISEAAVVAKVAA